jgi:Cu(I)/Ag(I) efflux system membrane protein CusA/SilA
VTVPFALIGGFWLMWLLGYNMSIATAVGFIALSGVAAEFGVVMLLYLKQALERKQAQGAPMTIQAVEDAMMEGAVLRVRPIAMTVAVILAGLVPIMWSSGTGAEVMQRIAAPMVGGMVVAPLLSAGDPCGVFPVAQAAPPGRVGRSTPVWRAATASRGVLGKGSLAQAC